MSVSPQALESMVLDPLTGVSAAGTLAIVALGLTEIEIVIFDSNELEFYYNNHKQNNLYYNKYKKQTK